MNYHYSESWFETFMPEISSDRTLNEIDFLVRHLPLPAFSKILDVCCGIGRHSLNLALKGYEVTGIDINRKALAKAKANIKSKDMKINFLHHDMRELSSLEEQYNSILNLWQSFGFFSKETNEDIIRQIYNLLAFKGRFIIDIFNYDFFVKHQGKYEFKRKDIHIIETKTIADGRLTIKLDYQELNIVDEYNFQIFTPKEFIEFIEKQDFTCILKCTNYNESELPNANHPRMQFIFEKK